MNILSRLVSRCRLVVHCLKSNLSGSINHNVGRIGDVPEFEKQKYHNSNADE